MPKPFWICSAGILGFMRNCLICGEPVVSKRKDAKYCPKPLCRKRAHQQRQEQCKAALPKLSANKASVVITFPDGSRWLMELSPLQPTDETNFPSLAQIGSASLPIRSGSDPPPSQPSPAASGATPSLIGTPEIRSEPILARPIGSELRTVELFFVDERGLRVPFRDAVQNRGRAGWRVRRHAKAQLGFHSTEGYGLGGSPGRWRDVYFRQSPSEFGLDGDLGVLFGDEEADQATVAPTELLREALGLEWRARLRAFCEERLRSAVR